MPTPRTGPYALMAFDIDGTLLTREGTISPRTRAAIDAARASGLVMMLASGRPEAGLRHLAERLELDTDGLILAPCNGSRVLRADTGEVLGEVTLGKDVADEVYRTVSDLPVALMIDDGPVLYANDPEGVNVPGEAKANGMELRIVPDLAELDLDPLKILMSTSAEAMVEVEPVVRQRLDGLGELARSAPIYLELTAKGSHKGRALESACAALGVPLSASIAFGDNENDLTMLAAAGHGVAMGNATPNALAAADEVTASHQDDGIALVLERVLA
ncbi:Cof-type HAD-IIB family hydrolase [Arsenicicoccus piscis]|uniref:Haloacid dehalogenase n=1 Tax=Arsenicicoccus piscis TaxID=673954 RepID=A0ABQ6HUE8_9MICO|nr:Cof-type HAD-IIB family hydrolase [Arsenicicoccus piscis]MCH8627337.1 Cof-type HAD-IIB family hydrolase [Arsenicicoccus piscis]GMA21483.1 haloacid dehalogenase [Arsenicicoccus piscis]